MTSAIVANFPATGSPVSKQGERDNWAAAKSEIERLQGLYVNVKDYGAVGNGSTDDTAAINAAIAAANTVVDAVLYFPRAAAYLVAGSTPLTALGPWISVVMDGPIQYNVAGSPLVTTFLWTIGNTGNWNPGGTQQGFGGGYFDLWFTTSGTNSYASNPNMGGVRFYNVVNSTIKCRNMGAFTIGLQLNASAGRYCSGNKVYLHRFSTQVGLELLADGAGAWIINNDFYGGDFANTAPNSIDKVAIRARSINSALNMHSLKFHNTHIEMGNDATHRSAAFETTGGVIIYGYNLYLESNSHLLYNTDGLGYVAATCVRIANAAQVTVTEGAFSGSYGINIEQSQTGNAEVAGTGARTLGQNDIGSVQRNTSGTATWTINKFIGKISVDNIDGGTLTLAQGTGVTLSTGASGNIAAGKVATLIGRVAGTKVQVLLEN